MPRIMQIKEIDGELWARVDIDTDADVSPIHLWTDQEARDAKDAAVRDAFRMLAEVATGQSGEP